MFISLILIWLKIFDFTTESYFPVSHLAVRADNSLGLVTEDKTLGIGPWRNNLQSLGMQISAKSAIVQDKASQTILWEKDADSVRSIASITKLLTVLVFLDQVKDMDQTIKITPEDYKFGGRRYIFTGQVIKARDLLGLSLVASSNESISALVRLTGLTEAEFVNKMNAKAKELKMVKSFFVEPTGLDAKNVSTAKDLLNLLDAALNIEIIRDLTTKEDYSLLTVSDHPQTIKVSATDKLLNSFLNVAGGKTGYLEEAGYCLATELKGDNNRAVRIVVLGSSSTDQRFSDVKATGWWVFKNFTWPDKLTK